MAASTLTSLVHSRLFVVSTSRTHCLPPAICRHRETSNTIGRFCGERPTLRRRSAVAWLVRATLRPHTQRHWTGRSPPAHVTRPSSERGPSPCALFHPVGLPALRAGATAEVEAAPRRCPTANEPPVRAQRHRIELWRGARQIRRTLFFRAIRCDDAPFSLRYYHRLLLASRVDMHTRATRAERITPVTGAAEARNRRAQHLSRMAVFQGLSICDHGEPLRNYMLGSGGLLQCTRSVGLLSAVPAPVRRCSGQARRGAVPTSDRRTLRVDPGVPNSAK